MGLSKGAAGLVLWGIGVLGVFGAASSKCPPGGQYLDKHLGEKGRLQCCSELCEVTWVQAYIDMCRKNCPDYQDTKARETREAEAGTADPPKPEVAAYSSSGEDSAHIVVVSVLVPVGILIIIALFVLMKRRGRAGGHSSILPFRNNRRGEARGLEDSPAPETVPMQNLEGGLPLQREATVMTRQPVQAEGDYSFEEL